MTSDRKLLRRARAYDQEALGELYDTYAARIYGYIYKRVQNAQIAENLTGDVFLRLLEAIQDEKAWRSSFTGWLYRIAHNLIVDHYRSEPPPSVRVDDLSLPGDDSIEETASDPFQKRQVRAALKQLTPDQQQVLALRFGEQMKSREVARILQKSVGAVEALQHRALNSLRRLLDEED